MAKQQKISVEQAKMAKEAQVSGEEYQLTLEQIADIQEKILKGQIKTNSELTKQLSAAKQITKQLQGQKILEDKIANDKLKKQDQIKKAREAIKSIDTDILNISGEMRDKVLTKLGKQNQGLLKDKVKELNAARKRIAIALQNKQITQNEAFAYRKILANQHGMVDSLQAINDKAPILAEAMQQAGDLAGKVQGKIDGFFTNIPGGGVLKKALGLDGIEKQLNVGISKGLGAMGKGLRAGASPLQALNMGFKAFNATVMLNPVVLVIAAVVALAILVKKLVNAYGEFEKLARDSAEQMGITVTQGKEMVKNAQNASTAFGVQLVNAKEVLDVQKQITEATGNSSMISADVAANVADTGKAFGYGVQAAGQLQGVFQNMGMASEDAAKMQMTLAKETLVQGVNTGKVIADINANAAKTNKFFRGDIKALTAAAVQANKMGISIADMAKTAESLLDFESSINAQMEFQALTGKEMNLDLARQLAFQGDIAGATKEVMNNIGSLAEFNEMLPHQQEAFAKAAGMSVDQISKGLAIQEAMPNATEEQRKAMESMGLTAADIANMSEEDLKKRLADEQAALKQEMAMENMKAQMMQALLPIGEAFSKIFAALTPILKVIAGLFKIIGFAIELILTPLEFVYSLFRESEAAIGGIFGGIMDIFSGDIAGGFAKIGQGIVRMILMPFQAIIDMARGIINFLIDGINLIPGVDIPLIPAFNLADSIMGLEEGGTVTTGGAFVVGEAGPEVVNLNAGDAVTPNDQLTGATGAAGADGASSNNSRMPSAAEIGAAVAKALTGIKFNTPPIQIGNEVIGAISAESDIQRSYKK